jgi:hypothetical protein
MANPLQFVAYNSKEGEFAISVGLVYGTFVAWDGFKAAIGTLFLLGLCG